VWSLSDGIDFLERVNDEDKKQRDQRSSKISASTLARPISRFIRAALELQATTCAEIEGVVKSQQLVQQLQTIVPEIPFAKTSPHARLSPEKSVAPSELADFGDPVWDADLGRKLL
jgi:hypothetical protein